MQKGQLQELFSHLHFAWLGIHYKKQGKDQQKHSIGTISSHVMRKPVISCVVMFCAFDFTYATTDFLMMRLSGRRDLIVKNQFLFKVSLNICWLLCRILAYVIALQFHIVLRSFNDISSQDTGLIRLHYFRFKTRCFP